MFNSIHIAYLAGIIDGEGHIGIMRKEPSGRFVSPHHTLRVEIGMYSDDVISWIQTKFDGNRYLKKPYITTNGVRRKVCHVICWQGQKALTLLKIVLPFLIEKKQQALISINYQKGCPKKGGKRLSKDEIFRRESAYLKIRKLNKKQS